MERIVFAQLSSIIEMNLLTRMMSMFASRGLKIGSITVTGGGQYSGTPAISFSGGGGTGGTATASVLLANVTGSVTSISGSQPSGWYSPTTSTPTVSFSGGGGSGATATANLSSGRVIWVTGNARTTLTSGVFTFSGGGGSGASATFIAYQPTVARMTYSAGYTITNGGSGYTSPPTVVYTDGFGQSITFPTASVTISGGQVTGITHLTNGEIVTDPNTDFGWYPSRPNITLSGGGGSGATAYISSMNLVSAIDYWCRHQNGSFSVNSNGDGYTSAPSVSVQGLVAGTSTLGSLIAKKVLSITLTNGGSGYSSSPSVTVSGGEVTPGYDTPSHAWTSSGSWYTYYYVNSISVTNSGSGYTSAPTVVISGGGVTSNATAIANMIPE